MDSLDSKSAISSITVESMAKAVGSVCDRHRVQRGRPGDLVGFLRALGKNKHLAMDFWSVVSRMSRVNAETAGEASAPASVETAALPDWRGRQERTLEAIVRAIAGTGTSGMAAAGVDAELAAMHMASLLAGDDTLYGEGFRGDAGFEEGRAWGLEGCCAPDEGVVFTASMGDPVAYAPMGDDELRRVLLEPGRPRGAAVKWRVRVRLPLWPRLWLRRWAAMWMPLVPQRRERAPRRMGLMLIGLALLVGVAIHAQSDGSLDEFIRWVRGAEGALEGLLRR